MIKKPKIKYQRILPFGKYIGITLYPYIFLKKKVKNYHKQQQNILINHEKIHFAQQSELIKKYNIFIGLIIFYSLYIYWWIKYGYKQIPFEKEAYSNQENLKYLKNRKPFSYKKYIK